MVRLEGRRTRGSLLRLVGWRLVPHVLAVLLFCHTAVTAAAGNGPLLRIDSQAIFPDQSFGLSFVIHGVEPSDLRMEDLTSVPDTLRLLSGPSILPHSSVAVPGGEARRGSEVRFEFRALKAGRRLIGPFQYIVKGRRMQTNGAVVEVSSRGRSFHVPHEVAWRFQRPVLYEGQTALLLLEAHNVEEIVVPDSISVQTPGDAVMEEVRGLGSIRSSAAGTAVLYTVPLASYLVTPSRRGRLVIPAARVRLQETNVQVPAYSVDIAALPDAAAASGAVGVFSFSSWLDTSESVPGVPITLRVRVEGEGNLDYLKTPDPITDALLVTEQSVLKHFNPSENGHRGYVEWIYRLSAAEPGEFTVRVPVFPWLDIRTGTVAVSMGRSFHVKIVEDPGELPIAEGTELGLLDAAAVRERRPRDLYRRPINYLALSPGVLLVLLALFRRRRLKQAALVFMAMGLVAAGEPAGGERTAESEKAFAAALTRAIAAADNPRQALPLMYATLSLSPDDPGIFYNIGVLHFLNGEKSRAVFNLRRALQRSPGDDLFAATLERVEREYGLLHQPAPPRFHPDLFFIAMLVCFNVMCFAIAGLLLRNKAGLVILLVFSVILTAGSLAAFISVRAEAARVVGVVGPTLGDLKRIPRHDAREWYLLDEGTAVKVIGATGDFYLVRTAYGVEGWLRIRDLIRE